jgi:hypothetical protein
VAGTTSDPLEILKRYCKATGQVPPEFKAVVSELESLCEAVAYADRNLNAAQEMASDESVASAHDAWAGAYDWMRSRLPEIRAELYARGGEDTIREVLDWVDPKYQATITVHWGA